jgi:hypothetical protein
MGEKALVEGQIADAMALVKALDARNASPTFALWYYYTDIEAWRLLIAGPPFDKLIPKSEAAAYRIIIDAISTHPVSSVSATDVKLVKTESSLPRTVGILIVTPPDALAGVHFTDNYINGIFIKEMYVIRSAARTLIPAI